MRFFRAYVFVLSSVITIGSTFKGCKTTPPFLDKLRHGVDITTLDLFPLSLEGSNGFRSPVIDFTCQYGKRKTLNEKEYDIPDQVWSLFKTPMGLLKSHVEIHKTSHALKKSMSINVGVELKGGLFGASGSYEKLQDYLTNSSKYIEELTSFTSASKVYMIPDWAMTIGHMSKMYIERFLPSNLNNTTLDSYLKFIETFGTHYFEEAKFGGLLRLTLATDQSYFKHKKDNFVKAQARATFFNIIKLSAGGSTKTQTVDSKFTRSSTKTIRYYGGNTNLLADGGIKAWQPSVANNPWLFGGRLKEISLIMDNSSKRKSMRRAVQVYTDFAYLKELVRIITWLSNKWSRNSGSLMHYNNKVQKLLQQTMPNHSEVINLGKTIEGVLTIPNWFKKTRLCFDWYADGNGGQCGGGVARYLCAYVNSMTAYYRDDTDRRGGGCQMRWGIFSKGYDNWFSEVKICYRWWPDGNGGQCGGGAKRLLCARINSYTSFYRDDTDRRSGGCQMQWKLDVPSNAPLWMKNARVCFEWYPDGDGGQCGGGAKRKLCARANSFTYKYRDDTDRRSGGCRMRWGIEVD